MSSEETIFIHISNNCLLIGPDADVTLESLQQREHIKTRKVVPDSFTLFFLRKF
jgi:hypothetical protein